jgi:hypothetical protein
VTPDELHAQLPAWIEAHVPDPLRGAMKDFAPSLTYNDMLKTALALPLREGVGQAELDRLDHSFELLVISAHDPNRVPRLGLWTSLAGAYAAAEALGGVVYDEECQRLLHLQPEPFPAQGEITAGRHLRVAQVVDPHNPGGFMCSGMDKFGLPDLMVLAMEGGEAFLVGVAQYLIESVLRAAAQASPVTALQLPPVFALDTGTMQRSGVVPLPAPPNVHVSLIPETPGRKAFLAASLVVIPPA